MATILAPMLTSAANPDAGARTRYAVTHVQPQYVVEHMTRGYVRQYGPIGARPFIARIEVLRGNVPPTGETFHHVQRGYDCYAS